ncbi:hypothetical protein BU16DRAFT_190734 [Lophium mytilinum]|uniref:Uncharacterized protein n=1 Tax=Lophium mytilinum TaxID=390894 RepID=A0A6A6RCE3_9PEZI|nr:hypothetical protein BU16DRAFT_190734 [Lophium mytilinum]
MTKAAELFHYASARAHNYPNVAFPESTPSCTLAQRHDRLGNCSACLPVPSRLCQLNSGRAGAARFALAEADASIRGRLSCSRSAEPENGRKAVDDGAPGMPQTETLTQSRKSPALERLRQNEQPPGPLEWSRRSHDGRCRGHKARWFTFPLSANKPIALTRRGKNVPDS